MGVQLSVPGVHLPFTVFWRASFLVLARVIPCFSARQNVLSRTLKRDLAHVKACFSVRQNALCFVVHRFQHK